MESVNSRSFEGYDVDIQKLGTSVTASAVGVITLICAIVGYKLRLLTEDVTVSVTLALTLTLGLLRFNK